MDIKTFLENQKSKRSADLEDLKKRVEALEKINTESEDEEELKATGEELDVLKAKKEELEKELADINAQIEELDKPAEGEEKGKRNKLDFMGKESRGIKTMTPEERKAAAEKFVANGRMTINHEETRAMLVSSGKIATPTGVSDTINELPNGVSSIIDMVNVEDCTGMGSNKIAYEYAAPEGGVTVEGESYAEGETVTEFVTTTPETITTISYLSKQVTKQTPLQYEAKVRKNALNALRKKVGKIIIDKIKASSLVVKKTIAKIDEKTLRTLAFSYGGDEEVQGNAVLTINKNTLVALGDVRGSNEKKAVYEITPDTSNPGTGTIKDGGLTVQYVINSQVSDNELIYGQAVKCELDIYSDYEIKVSEDFKFDKGMLAIRGDVEADVAVTHKDGFIVATVGAGA